MECLICGTLFLHISTSLWCFCPRTIYTKKRIGQVSSDLLFTLYTRDNQQWFSRLSNWFSLQCLGPWMSHLSPVWWSTFRFRLLIINWCESLIWWIDIFLFISCLFHVLYITQVLPIVFPLKLIYSSKLFYNKFNDILHRRSLHLF